MENKVEWHYKNPNKIEFDQCSKRANLMRRTFINHLTELCQRKIKIFFY